MDHKLPPDIWYLISSRLSRKDNLSLAMTSRYLLEHLLPPLYRIVHLDLDLQSSNVTLELLARGSNLSRSCHALKLTGKVVACGLDLSCNAAAYRALRLTSNVPEASNRPIRPESNQSSVKAFVDALPKLGNLRSLSIPSSFLSSKDAQIRFFGSLSHLNLDELCFHGSDQLLFRENIQLPRCLKSFTVENWNGVTQPLEEGSEVGDSLFWCILGASSESIQKFTFHSIDSPHLKAKLPIWTMKLPQLRILDLDLDLFDPVCSLSPPEVASFVSAHAQAGQSYQVIQGASSVTRDRAGPCTINFSPITINDATSKPGIIHPSAEVMKKTLPLSLKTDPFTLFAYDEIRNNPGLEYLKIAWFDFDNRLGHFMDNLSDSFIPHEIRKPFPLLREACLECYPSCCGPEPEFFAEHGKTYKWSTGQALRYTSGILARMCARSLTTWSGCVGDLSRITPQTLRLIFYRFSKLKVINFCKKALGRMDNLYLYEHILTIVGVCPKLEVVNLVDYAYDALLEPDYLKEVTSTRICRSDAPDGGISLVHDPPRYSSEEPIKRHTIFKYSQARTIEFLSNM